jgi:hypothetical protein
MQELYPHMADGDYRDIFSQPDKAGFIIGFDKEELLARMVQVPGEDIRKIVIPRNTTVVVAETSFSLQYPIEVRQMSHGGLQIVYDVKKTSPLRTLKTNVIEWQTVTMNNNREMVVFGVELDQFQIHSKISPINVSQKFSLSLTIEDNFYYCRVFNEVATGVWSELRTTYTDEIYSNITPTAIVSVVGKQVRVQFPLLYTKNGGLVGNIRVDVYDTKGPLSLDLGGYNTDQFSAKWLAIDKSEQTVFVAPLKAMQSVMLRSSAITTGGNAAMDFSAMRKRMIKNAIGSPQLPITPAQVQGTLERNGYNIVKNVEHITNRVFAATRAMPVPLNSELITAASAGISTLVDTVEKMAMQKATYENVNSITLSPQCLYRLRNGVLSMVVDAERDALEALPGDKRALAITEGGYFYSPFHYVLDTNGDTFSSRPYYLDSPEIKGRSFLAENDKTLLQVSSKEVSVVRTPTGYRILVLSTSSEAWKSLDIAECAITLGFQPDRTGDYAYLVGKFLGHTDKFEQVWGFDIDTSYYINEHDKLEITNAMMYDATPMKNYVELLQTFELFYSTSSVMPIGWAPTTFEDLIGEFLVPAGSCAVTREKIDVLLGHSLEHLWSRGRSVVGEQNYVLWAVDVAATYDSVVYQANPDGSIFTVVNGALEYNVLHRAGDPMLDAEGNVIYKHRVGDIKFDAYQRPLIARSRSMTRQFDLLLIEAAYFYASNVAAIDYRNQLVKTIVKWVTSDLGSIAANLLDKTDLFFYPTQTVGRVDVVFGAGLKTTIDAGQSFNLQLFVKDSVYRNESIKEKLRQKTVRVISEQLSRKTVAVSNIIDALRDAYQNDVISFEVSNLGGVANLSTVTMVDDGARLSIRKRLDFRADESFALREDVTVFFVPHELQGIEIG